MVGMDDRPQKVKNFNSSKFKSKLPEAYKNDFKKGLPDRECATHLDNASFALSISAFLQILAGYDGH